MFVLFPEPLLNIFKESGQAAADAELLRIGVPALRIISLSFLPAAFGILFSTVFQATGKGIQSLVVSLLRQMVILLPAAWLLSLTGEVTNVWFAFPVAEILACFVSIGMFWNLYRKHLKNL